jgi:hypothetical protein
VAGEDLALAHGHGVLEVLPPELVLGQRAIAAAVDERRRLVEIALLAGDPKHFDQRGLDLGVAAEALVGEGVADVVGDLFPHVDQLGGSAGAGGGDRGLQ